VYRCAICYGWAIQNVVGSIKYRESTHGASKIQKLHLHTNNSVVCKIDKGSKWLNITDTKY